MEYELFPHPSKSFKPIISKNIQWGLRSVSVKTSKAIPKIGSRNPIPKFPWNPQGGFCYPLVISHNYGKSPVQWQNPLFPEIVQSKIAIHNEFSHEKW